MRGWGTLYGEKVLMRILDELEDSAELEERGLRKGRGSGPGSILKRPGMIGRERCQEHSSAPSLPP